MKFPIFLSQHFGRPLHQIKRHFWMFEHFFIHLIDDAMQRQTMISDQGIEFSLDVGNWNPWAIIAIFILPFGLKYLSNLLQLAVASYSGIRNCPIITSGKVASDEGLFVINLNRCWSACKFLYFVEFYPNLRLLILRYSCLSKSIPYLFSECEEHPQPAYKVMSAGLPLKSREVKLFT